MAKHKYFTIPALDFRGTPTGVDIRKVVEKRYAAARQYRCGPQGSGVGQVGAGVVTPPS